MPLDLTAPNSILNAYIQGMNIRKRNEQQAFENKFKTERAKEAVDMFNKRLQQEMDIHNKTQQLHQAQFDVTTALAKMQVAEQIAKGNIPANLRPSVPQDTSGALGLPSFESATAPTEQIKGPVSYGPISLEGSQYQTPEEHGQAQLEAQGPLLKAKYDFENAQKVFESILKMQEQAAQQKEIGKRNIELKKLEGPQKEKEIRLRNDAILGAAQIRANAARAGRLDKPISITDLQALNANGANLKPGTTYSDISGMEITPLKQLPSGQQDKLNAYQSIFNDLTKLRDLGEKTQWKAHLSTVLPTGMYEKYKAAHPGEDSQDVVTYRAMLGRFTAEELHRLYGSVLSKGELERAVKFVAALGDAPRTAKGRIDVSLGEIQNQMKTLLNPSRMTPNAPSTAIDVDALVNKHRQQ